MKIVGGKDDSEPLEFMKIWWKSFVIISQKYRNFGYSPTTNGISFNRS